jgi:hypothetical protein
MFTLAQIYVVSLSGKCSPKCVLSLNRGMPGIKVEYFSRRCISMILLCTDYLYDLIIDIAKYSTDDFGNSGSIVARTWHEANRGEVSLSLPMSWSLRAAAPGIKGGRALRRVAVFRSMAHALKTFD